VEVADAEAETRAEVEEKLAGLEGASHREALDDEAPGIFRFFLDAAPGKDLRRDLFGLCVAQGWSLLELHQETQSLEDVFRDLTKE
jgi:ABC-2 type transport system ATP-binding protein